MCCQTRNSEPLPCKPCQTCQTLASGSVSLDVEGAREKNLQAPTTSEGVSGGGVRPVGGDLPLAWGGEPAAQVRLVSAQAEAEAEIEAVAEFEAEIGSASAVAGISAAVAAVGTDVFVGANGNPEVVAEETVTSIDGRSGTSTSVSNGGVQIPAVSPRADDEGTPAAPAGTAPGETYAQITSAALQEGLDTAEAVQTDTEGEVEIEAEIEAEAEAETGTAAAAVGAGSGVAVGSAIGNASAASGVALGGILTARAEEVSTGVSAVARRPAEAPDETREREAVPSQGTDNTVAEPGSFEVEAEAEAEAEAEVEVGFNAAGAGAGAVAGEARNSFIGLTADAATATSTSVSVKDGGEKVFDHVDAPGPEPLDNFGGLAPQAVDLNATILEVETEAEAEAEVGYNAGAAAGAAVAAGFEGISAVIDMDATTNSAATAAAAGAYTSVSISVPPEGMAGWVTAMARAWDPEGRGVSAAVAVAGLSEVAGFDNEREAEAEGLFEVLVEVSVYTEAYDPNDIAYLFDVAPTVGAAMGEDGEPNGVDARLESEAEAETEVEAEAGYGVAGAAAAAAVSGFAATAVSDTRTATGEVGAASDIFGQVIAGTAAGETLTGGAKVDLLQGGGGADRLEGGASGDRLEGGAGDDLLFGGAGGDSILGGQGNDIMNGGAGADFLIGGGGVDFASYRVAAEGVKVSLATSQNSRGEAEGDLFAEIEGVLGSAFEVPLVS